VRDLLGTTRGVYQTKIQQWKYTDAAGNNVPLCRGERLEENHQGNSNF